MKNYNHLFLAIVIVLGIAVFLIPCGTKAAGPSSGLFTFISPLGGEEIVVGKTYNIEWKGPIKWIVAPKVIESILDVKLTLSCGDPSLGATNNTVIVKSTANDGLYKWSVPKKLGSSDYCRITIEDTKGKYRDVSSVFGIGITPSPTLNVSCSASPSSANINQTVTFISSVSGGTGSYSYSWSGACTGSSANCSNSFLSSGNYNASLTVISGSQSKSANCSVNVTAPAGSISSAVDGSTPLAQVVSGGQQITAAKFKFTASNDSYTITEAKVSVANAAASAVINSAILKDGSTILANVASQPDNTFYFTGLNISVPANTTKVLTVNLSLGNPFTDGTTITTGKNVKLSLILFKSLNSQGIQVVDSNTRTANDLYVYKSIPTLTVGSAPTGQGVNLSAGATTTLYRFNIAADTKGDIALKQLKFNTTVSKNSSGGSTPALSNFKFFRGSTDITSAVTIQNNSGNNLEGTTSIGTGTNIIVVTFDTEEVAPAGTTYAYTLKAIPSGFSASVDGNDSVATSILADSSASADSALYFLSAASNTGIQTLYSAANHGGGDTSENVIWSDNSALMHDYSYNASSSDWFNGYLINNLPLDSIGIVAQ